MSNRRKDSMDVRELLSQLRLGASDRQISRDMRLARQTVKRYREWAQANELLEGKLPAVEELQALLERSLPMTLPPQNTSSVEPYREMVKQLVEQEVETAAIYQRIRERGYSGSYSAVYRFVQAFKPGQSKATVRVERQPGEDHPYSGVPGGARGGGADGALEKGCACGGVAGGGGEK